MASNQDTRKTLTLHSSLLLVAALGITAYFNDWMMLFYIASSIVTLILVATTVGSLIYNKSWLHKSILIGVIMLYVLIGYIVTQHWLDGALLGICLAPFMSLVEYLYSPPLKTIFQHKVCIDKLYADSFYKVQKSSHSSFEVICCGS